MSSMNWLAKIDVVLVATSHPGNIGAAARAVKTMGLERLVLVNPRRYPSPEAERRSAGAEDVLKAARVESDLGSALATTTLVFGTSARPREVNWPVLTPREAGLKAIDHLISDPDHRVAIVFGNETSGLSNAELDYCDVQIVIPANASYGSLNMASAVQIIAYEMRMAALGEARESAPGTHQKPRQQLASVDQTQGHLNHLQAVLEELDFAHNKNSPLLMRKLTRLYNRASLSVEEVQILRGILTAIQKRITGSLN